MKGFFVTGTDTDCGKTRVAVDLIRLLGTQGKTVAPYKPVAAGASINDGHWQNDDALALIEAAGGDWIYTEVNPYCFEAPVSPHLAARDTGGQVSLPLLQEGARSLAARADCLVVEGAGGWLVPLSDSLDIADLALALDLPVVLVVGLRLGCLNHARVSEQAVLHSGVRLAGWVASQVDPNMARVDENLETLHNKLQTPCLGVASWGGGVQWSQAILKDLLDGL